jgi:LmbE family N-acetylglucosaminyl deacetylase
LPEAGATRRVALAVAAHPDDIEFLMAGTLLELRAAGWETHYLNVGSGNLGSLVYGPAQTRAVRRQEAQTAAGLLGAIWHAGVAEDLEILYTLPLLRRLAAVIREVEPGILLTHSPQDYMEDHVNTCRLAVTATFARGMKNFRTRPARPASGREVTVYHAMPHGLHDGLRRRIMPGLYVDTTAVQATKREALAAHSSQRTWLDASQGLGSYVEAMEAMARDLGRRSGRFQYAEGWRRHAHLGFCGPDTDPLRQALGTRCLVNDSYERDLDANAAFGH